MVTAVAFLADCDSDLHCVLVSAAFFAWFQWFEWERMWGMRIGLVEEVAFRVH